MLLSVDQSFTSSGIVILTDEEEVFHAEIFKSNAEQDIFQRAWNIAEYVASLADHHSVRFISMEGLAYAKAGDATRDLAGLQFILVCVLRFIHNYYVEVVYPTTVKKFATGKGNSKKQQLLECLPSETREWFEQHLNVKKTTGLMDLTDAYWIGRYAMQKVSKDYVSKPIDQHTLDDITEQTLCQRLQEQTGYQARINKQTLIPEIYVDNKWVQIELAE